MSLDPLLAASPVVQIHAFAAMAAFALGLVQFAGPMGTTPHRVLGYAWVGLMLLIAGSSFSIRGVANGGEMSAIHALSAVVLVLVPLAALAAHRHNVRRHKIAMVSLFAGALVIAGAFTLAPGRIMHGVVFGD
jgi:uncharacterized membrane protein